jgi:hypothetical protein
VKIATPFFLSLSLFALFFARKGNKRLNGFLGDISAFVNVRQATGEPASRPAAQLSAKGNARLAVLEHRVRRGMREQLFCT